MTMAWLTCTPVLRITWAIYSFELYNFCFTNSWSAHNTHHGFNEKNAVHNILAIYMADEDYPLKLLSISTTIEQIEVQENHGKNQQVLDSFFLRAIRLKSNRQPHSLLLQWSPWTIHTSISRQYTISINDNNCISWMDSLVFILFPTYTATFLYLFLITNSQYTILKSLFIWI